MSGPGPTGGAERHGTVAAAGPGSPDAFGREMAEGPAAVVATLAQVERSRPRLDAAVAVAGRIVLIGTGASLAVAHTVAPLWRRAAAARRPSARMRAVDVVVRESAAAVLGDVDGQAFRRDDLVIAISQSGTSPETLAATRLARATGSAVLAVTAHPESPLDEAASLSLPVASGEEKDASTKSALATLAALLGTAGLLPADAGREAVVRLRAVAASPGIGAAGGRLAGARNVWLLGFGPALGLAEAGALLWHEKVVRSAVATTPSEFRHGLVEASSGGDAVVLLEVDVADDRRTAYVERLREELRALDVPIVEFAPPAARTGLPTGSEPAIRALETLLWVQHVARAAALTGGTYRDGFEILRRVVLPADDIVG